MINFRFHLVSLVAVFLALGLGILVGSTVVDQGIVNRLDTEIRHVGNENSAQKAASKALSKQNSDLQKFIDLTEPFVGDARLDGYEIAVVAEHGVDRGTVKQAEQALQAAGADVPGVLWLDDSWQLDSDSRVQDLASALNLHGSVPAMRNTALHLFAQRLAKAPATNANGGTSSTSTSSTTKPKGTTASTSVPHATSTGPHGSSTTSTTAPTAVPPIDALTALEQAGFLSVTDGAKSAFDTFPAHVVDVLVITGDDSDFAGTDLTSTFVRALVDTKLPTVVGAVYDAGSNAATAPKRGAALASVLDDQVLSRAASTVDDLDQVQGRVAAVLSLEIIGSGDVGHYGYGTGASAPLPPHRS